MAEIWTMGEALVEIMRTEVDQPLGEKGIFEGPFPSGSSCIMASTVARLGHSSGVVSGVGNDEFGKCILERLEKDGVDISRIKVDEDRTTACAFVSYDKYGDRKFIFHWKNTAATQAEIPDIQDKQFEDTKFFHVMGCALTADLEYGWKVVKMAKLMKKKGVKISFDPNIRVEHLEDAEKSKESLKIINEIMEITNVFAPGEDELKLLAKIEDTDGAVKKCFENKNLEILFLKKGSKGSKIYGAVGEVIEQALYKVDVIDPTGAGDTSIGAFLCGLIEEKSLAECAEIAAAAGALNVATFGPMEGDVTWENIQRIRVGSN